MLRRRAALLLALVALCGCSTERSLQATTGPAGASPTPRPTITMIEVPTAPPSGRIDAVITQSSHDRAHGRVQVLLSNGTAHLLRPRRIVYADPRLAVPVAATHLRALPPGGHRGYPVALPAPVCAGAAIGSPRLTVETSGGAPLSPPVADENDDVGRYVEAACFERRTARAVRLRLGVRIPDDVDAAAQLVVASRRVGSAPVRLLSMLGTPLFAPDDASGAWHPRAALGTGAVRLPVVPARCDPHAFGEGGEMTAFAVTLDVGGHRGSFKLSLGVRDKRALYAYALAHCGLGDELPTDSATGGP